jgi:hypothetical protein
MEPKERPSFSSEFVMADPPFISEPVAATVRTVPIGTVDEGTGVFLSQ